MIHNLRLHPEPFALIESGQKNIESRLNDEKRQTFKIGDTLIFTSRADGKEIKTVITIIHHHPTFSDLFSQHPLEKFGNKGLSELLEEIEIYYPKTEQEKYGVVGVEFIVLDKI